MVFLCSRFWFSYRLWLRHLCLLLFDENGMGVFVEDGDLMPSIKPIREQTLTNGTTHTHDTDQRLPLIPRSPLPLCFIFFDADR